MDEVRSSLLILIVTFNLFLFIFLLEDEFNLLVIVMDVNPIWWGQQAQREPEVWSLLYTTVPVHYCILL